MIVLKFWLISFQNKRHHIINAAIYFLFLKLIMSFTYFIRCVQPNSPASSFPTLCFPTWVPVLEINNSQSRYYIACVFIYIFHLVQKPLLFFSTYLTIDAICHSVKVLPTPGCFALATDCNLGVQHVLKVHKTLFLAFPSITLMRI